MKVQTPRFRRALDVMLDSHQRVGPAAMRVATQNAMAGSSATFALDGVHIDPEARVATRIKAGDKVELVLGF